MKNKRKYRFFYHYYKQFRMMSVHFRGKCYIVQNVVCELPCETKWKTTQPNLVMQGFASELVIEGETATIK